MTEKDTSKKTTWEKLNIAAKQDTSKSTNDEKTLSAKKEKLEEKQLSLPTHEALEAQLLEMENQSNECKNQLAKLKEENIYLLAEMENMQRRHDRAIGNNAKFAIEKIVKSLVSTLASFETACQFLIAKNDPDSSGFQLIFKKLITLLKENGVTIIDPNGKEFDSHYHEAMLIEETDEFAPNTIIRVLQKGYLLHDRLIQPALVVVAKAKEKTS